MICPDCNSVILQLNSEVIKVEVDGSKIYQHTCLRCHCELKVSIIIVRHGNPSLVSKYKSWLHEERKS